MAEQVTIPEPPDGQLVMVGSEDNELVFLRDDRGLKPDDLQRWYSLNGEDDTYCLTWTGVVAQGGVALLYTRAHLDAAVREASVIPVGAHLKEPGGWCRTCSGQHSETEWARVHDQLAEEVDRG